MEPIYQEYQSGGRMEVNISRIKVWRKNGGKYIRYTNQYQEYRSKEGMKVNISKIQVWWKNGGKFIKDTDLEDAFEVYISGIPVWKNEGRITRIQV